MVKDILDFDSQMQFIEWFIPTFVLHMVPRLIDTNQTTLQMKFINFTHTYFLHVLHPLRLPSLLPPSSFFRLFNT